VVDPVSMRVIDVIHSAGP